MNIESAHRSVTVDRRAPGQFTVTNVRGGTLTVGRGDDGHFTPTELLLSALGACTAIDVDILVSRRSQPDAYEVVVDATKVRDEEGNRLTDIEVTFRVTFPAGAEGDSAGAVLPGAVQRSHDRLCTVGRTVELGTPVTARILSGS
jgi:uncharacterized OsmC-like protein